MKCSEKLNAIILAGTDYKKDKLIDEYDREGPKNKSLVKISNEPVILNVIKALKNSQYINKDKIAVIGPKQKLEKIIKENNPKILIIQEKRTAKENAKKAYDILSPSGEKTYFIVSDLPFIKPKTIDNFISNCNNNSNFYFGLIEEKNIPKEIEQFKKSMKLHLHKKGKYRTANMGVFESNGMKNRKTIEHELEKIFERRRTTGLIPKWKLYARLAKKYWKEIIIYSLGLLTQENFESSIKRKMGIKFKFIEIKEADAAADIDYQEEFEFFKKNYEKLRKKIK